MLILYIFNVRVSIQYFTILPVLLAQINQNQKRMLAEKIIRKEEFTELLLVYRDYFRETAAIIISKAKKTMLLN